MADTARFVDENDALRLRMRMSGAPMPYRQEAPPMAQGGPVGLPLGVVDDPRDMSIASQRPTMPATPLVPPTHAGTDRPERQNFKARNPLHQGLLGKRAIGGLKWGDLLGIGLLAAHPRGAMEAVGGFLQGQQARQQREEALYENELTNWQREQDSILDAERYEKDRLFKERQFDEDVRYNNARLESDADTLAYNKSKDADNAKNDRISGLQKSRDNVLSNSGPLAAQPYEIAYRREAGIPIPPTPLGQPDVDKMGLGFLRNGFQGLNESLAGSLQDNEPILLGSEPGSKLDYQKARAEKARSDVEFQEGPKRNLVEAQTRLITDGRLPEALARIGYTNAQTKLILEGKIRLNEAQIAALENLMGYRTGMLGVAQGGLGVRQYAAPYQAMGAIGGMIPEGSQVYAPNPFGGQPTLPPFATDPNGQMPPVGGLPYMPTPPAPAPSPTPRTTPAPKPPASKPIPLTRKGATPKAKVQTIPIMAGATSTKMAEMFMDTLGMSPNFYFPEAMKRYQDLRRRGHIDENGFPDAVGAAEIARANQEVDARQAKLTAKPASQPAKPKAKVQTIPGASWRKAAMPSGTTVDVNGNIVKR